MFVAIVASILPQREGFLWGLAAVGLVCLLFSTLSLTVGYPVPRLARIGHRQAVAAAMEMGIHNAVLAITVTITVLDNPIAAVAPAMYGALMYLPAAAFAWLVGRRAQQARPSTAVEGAAEPSSIGPRGHEPRSTSLCGDSATRRTRSTTCCPDVDHPFVVRGRSFPVARHPTSSKPFRALSASDRCRGVVNASIVDTPDRTNIPLRGTAHFNQSTERGPR